MKRPLTALILGLLAAASTAAFAQNTIDNELTSSTQVIQSLTGPQSEAGIPDDILRSAKCIAVIPKMLQAGFVVGGRHGNGVATCRTAESRWSPPAPFSLSGGSFGLQIGGEEMGYVMLAMNQKGMEALMSGHFKVGAGVDATAGPVGRDAEGGAGWKAASMLSYARSKGAYVGATLQGAELNQDHGATKALYGQELPFDSILNGHVPMPEQGPAHEFVHTINRAVERASR
jgi:SH3 domain-containing YSC84-like protein 1